MNFISYNVFLQHLRLSVMSIVKTILSISLSLLILLQSFSKVWIIVSFNLRQAEIAREQCVNRYVPEQLCSGKCVLLENLTETDKEQKQTKFPSKIKEYKEIAYFYRFAAPLSNPNDSIVTPSCQAFYYKPLIGITSVRPVFHPPDLRLV